MAISTNDMLRTLMLACAIIGFTMIILGEKAHISVLLFPAFFLSVYVFLGDLTKPKRK